jgi:hypothetical protein
LPKNIIWDSDIDTSKTPKKFHEYLWDKWVNSFYKNDRIAVRGIDPDFFEGLNLNIETIEETTEELKQPRMTTLFDHNADSDNENGLYGEVACHFPFTSEHPLGKIIIGIPQKPYLKNELIEMGATKIAIVDDRIWRERNWPCIIGRYKDNTHKKLLTVWQKRGVKICNVENAIKDFESFVEKFPDQEYHFLIFHQGEIDEIKKRTKINFNALWNRLKRKVSCTVIDTGRGVPDQAQKDNLKYVPFSLLQEYIINKSGDSLAKKGLVDYLFSVKATGDING